MSSTAARELSAHTSEGTEPKSPPARRELLSRHQRWRTAALQQGSNAARSRLEVTWYGACKMALEWMFAAALLVVTGPVIIVTGILTWLTSRGPMFYTQTRVGKNGKLFTIYKIRTMMNNCEKQSGAKWATVDDPRITPLGKFLRKTHLDELPQLINVLRCDMSLVGPRPERPEFMPALERSVPHYRDRLLVRPGVTGLAQVQLPADTDIESVRQKLAYDLYYITHAGPWLDLRLIFCTAIHMVGVPYHTIGRIFRLPGRQTVEHAYSKRVVGTADAQRLMEKVALQSAPA